MHTPLRQYRDLGTFDGQRKAAAEFNPFFPSEKMKARQPEGDSVLEVICSILALLAFFHLIGLWTGAL